MSSPLTKIGITYTQVRQEERIFPVIPRSIEREICTKMLRNLGEKFGAKFPSATLGYSMLRISCLDDAFAEILELEASPVVGQHL